MGTLGSGPVEVSQSSYAKFYTLPLKSVRLDSKGVLGERQTTNRKVGLQHGYDQLKKAGNFYNLELAAGIKTVEKDGPFRGPLFMDSDLYKWLEAVALEHLREPDPLYVKWMEETVSLIAKAQRPDGYLNSYYQIVEPAKRWVDIAMGHELYCAGHLIQAAVAHERITGKGLHDPLIQVVCKFAACIAQVFGPNPGQKATCCGHPEIESALIELYRTTRDPAHLKLAEFFINVRGTKTLEPGNWIFGGPAYAQDATPVREANAMIGHAVRQLYYLAGVTDLYLEKGEPALLSSMERLWEQMTQQQMYLTGGVGPRHGTEAFGDPYELPQTRCYCETCAAIASLFWNFRMLLITGNAQYADLFETTLYNAVLTGLSVSGTRYFYVNPRASNGGIERPEWHGCACCPPNVMRLLSSIQSYMATGHQNTTQIHLYDTATFQNAGLKLNMQTRYPYDGQVKITVEAADADEHALSLRIPAWCLQKEVTIRFNGKNIPVTAGYTTIKQVFKTGDVIELNFPMQPVWMEGHPMVESTLNCIALQRGPLVYCAEQQDQPAGVELCSLEVSPANTFKENWRKDLLGGTLEVTFEASSQDMSLWKKQLYRRHTTENEKNISVRAIPYYLWANRSADMMRVWFPKKD